MPAAPAGSRNPPPSSNPPPLTSTGNASGGCTITATGTSAAPGGCCWPPVDPGATSPRPPETPRERLVSSRRGSFPRLRPSSSSDNDASVAPTAPAYPRALPSGRWLERTPFPDKSNRFRAAFRSAPGGGLPRAAAPPSGRKRQLLQLRRPRKRLDGCLPAFRRRATPFPLHMHQGDRRAAARVPGAAARVVRRHPRVDVDADSGVERAVAATYDVHEPGHRSNSLPVTDVHHCPGLSPDHVHDFMHRNGRAGGGLSLLNIAARASLPTAFTAERPIQAPPAGRRWPPRGRSRSRT